VTDSPQPSGEPGADPDPGAPGPDYEAALAAYRTMLERALERLSAEPLEGVEPALEPELWR
jgi:hypothetical protein